MAQSSLNIAQVTNFLREHSAPFLFNSAQASKKCFALALASPGEKIMDHLRSTIIHNKPAARVLTISAPEGKNHIHQFREFISDLMYRLGEPPLHHGQETAVSSRLRKILSKKFDFLIIDHAENLGMYSFNLLHNNNGCPLILLVAYDDRILDTILGNEQLLKHVFMLN